MDIDEKIFRGNTGELSHILISKNDIISECGEKRCPETKVALCTKAWHVMEGIKSGVFSEIQSKKDDFAEAFARAIMHVADGGGFCIALISGMVYKIGEALAILIHIINLEQVLLSSGVPKVRKLLVVQS